MTTLLFSISILILCILYACIVCHVTTSVFIRFIDYARISRDVLLLMTDSYSDHPENCIRTTWPVRGTNSTISSDGDKGGVTTVTFENSLRDAIDEHYAAIREVPPILTETPITIQLKKLGGAVGLMHVEGAPREPGGSVLDSNQDSGHESSITDDPEGESSKFTVACFVPLPKSGWRRLLFAP